MDIFEETISLPNTSREAMDKSEGSWASVFLLFLPTSRIFADELQDNKQQRSVG